MTDYLADAFGYNTNPIPSGAPCRPAVGATPKQGGHHADQWHPDRFIGHNEAKRLCAGCPVTTQCLAANLHEPEGVWGGTTPDQRKKLRNGAAA